MSHREQPSYYYYYLLCQVVFVINDFVFANVQETGVGQPKERDTKRGVHFCEDILKFHLKEGLAGVNKQA